MADEDKRKHLDLIQGVITRMASSSFLLKGWSVTLTTALLGLSAKNPEPKLALVALLPILVFWGLDAYYLGYEWRFRELYATAIKSLDSTDFGMTPQGLGFTGWLKAAFRPAVVGLHLPLALAAVGVFYALLCRC